MKKIVSYESLTTLLNTLTKKINFAFDGANFGAMVANDGKVIIRDYRDGKTLGRKQFLEQFSTNYTPKIEIEEPSQKPLVSNADYKQCFIKNPLLSTEFLNYLQIPQFYTDYEEHENIGLFDFDALKRLHPTLYLRNKKNVLFFRHDVGYNISVKWDSAKGWQSVKGTKGSIGAFLRAKNPTSTLILVEGLKDAINANIAFPTADILAVNGKENVYNFKAHDIDLKKYRAIIFANDKEVSDENLIKMFPTHCKQYYKKTKCINWNMIKEGKDLTDLIQNIILPKYHTKREILRGSLSELKKLLEKNSFIEEYTKQRVKEATQTLNKAIKTDNINMAMRAIKTLNLFDGDLTRGVDYYLKKQNEVKSKNSLDIQLGENNRLSDHTDKIIAKLCPNSKVFLNAPTGTGKGYVALTELPKRYKNIIIVSPLRMVTNEHGASTTPYTDVQFNDRFEAVEADLNSQYIAITTDAFIRLKSHFKHAFQERLEKAALVIFDEQHLYYDSKGFRDETVVACYDYLLEVYEGTTLFMSGTPILPKHIEVSLITAKVLEHNKEIIKFSCNPFEDIEEIVKSMRDELDHGAILVYVNSRAKVEELNNLLQENSIKNLSITSYAYKLDGEIVEDTILTKDLGKIAYISTTKATTGVNFEHLRAIYQYGTAYTPNTLIQLMARLRKGGKYFLIDPQYKAQTENYNAKRAIGLSLAFQKMNIVKLSASYDGEAFQKWLSSFVLISRNNHTLKGLFKTYQKSFQLLEAKGLGKFNKTNDDFIFSGHKVTNIEALFENDDKNEFRKHIEQIIIDWTLRHDIELLNTNYNLSFKIVNTTYKRSSNKHQLVTEVDKEIKKAKRSDTKDEMKILYDEINIKLESVGITSKLLKKHGFTDTELSKINSIKLHLEKLGAIQTNHDKVTALKFHIIPKQAIFKIANECLIANESMTIKELDSQLQRVFITNARSKNPYEKLLIELFSNEVFNNSYLNFSKRAKVKGKHNYNTLTIAKEHKKTFDAIRTKRSKERYLMQGQERLMEEFKSRGIELSYE